MVISLDNEISLYKPYGRKIINWIPSFKNRGKSSKKKEFDVKDGSHSKIYFNDFIAAELDTSRDLFRSTNDVSMSIENTFAMKDFWRIRKSHKGEEELYVNENCVILSYKQLNGAGNSFIDKTFTFNEKILDAVWCNFIMNDNINSVVSRDFATLMFKDQPQAGVSLSSYPKFVPQSPREFTPAKKTSAVVNLDSLNRAKSLVVLDRYSIHILMENGDHYQKALQFEVKKILPTSYGLFFERVLHENENQLLPPFPSIFSLSNPLSDISPVLISGFQAPKKLTKSTSVSYVTKHHSYSLVAIIEEKNLLIFYCSKSGTHAIYHLRPINKAEVDWIQKDLHRCSSDSVMDVDKSSHLEPAQLISTPVANAEVGKKQCRLSYNSPVTRSMSSNFLNNCLNKTGRGSSPLTVDRGSQAASIGNNNITNSPHTRQSLTSEMKRPFSTHSPFSKMSYNSLISSRIDSPASPGLNRLHYSNPTGRLSSEVADSHLNPTFAAASGGGKGSSSNSATPSITKNSDSAIHPLSEPIIAELTLQFVWSEAPLSGVEPPSVAASKVFATCDFLGQQYLCLLISSNRNILESGFNSILKLIKFDQFSANSTDESRYIFSSTKYLTVTDAEPLESLNMIVVLEESSALALYSGLFKVATINLNPSPQLARSLSKKCEDLATPKARKISGLNLESPAFETLFSASGSKFKPKKIHTSSPLITSGSVTFDSKDFSTSMSKNLDPQKCNDSLTFAPAHYPLIGRIVSLSNSIDNQVTFETDDSQLFRLSFPPMASTFLVDKCLAALRQTLPKEVGFQFITAWYKHRNLSNRDDTNGSEIGLFKLCLLGLIGYQCEGRKGDDSGEEFSMASWSKSILSSPPDHGESLEKEITKKMKIQDDASEEDWKNFVQHSANLYGLNKNSLLNHLEASSSSPKSSPSLKRKKSAKQKRPMRVKTTTTTMAKAQLKPKCRFSQPEALYPYTPHILYSLHLIYEDLKLIQMNWPLCKSLVDILYRFAIDLELFHYQDHYMRDFPSICSQIYSESSESSFTQHKAKLEFPSYFSQHPPSIYPTLFSLLDGKTTDLKQCFPFIGTTGSVAKILTTWGAHVITENIFNLVILFSNLYQPELVDPQMVLTLVGNNVAINFGHSMMASHINVDKFKQISTLYSPLDRLSAGEGSLKRKSQLLGELRADCVREKRTGKEKILFLMSALGMSQEYLKQLPFGLALPLWSVIFDFRLEPKTDWCSSIYSLIGRPDLISLEHSDQHSNLIGDLNDEINCLSEEDESELAYIDFPVLRLIFPNDQRFQEAFQLLTSSKPILINIKQSASVSDSDFADEQEKHLYALSIRAMALPLGRAMMTLCSYAPVMVEKFPIPPLVLYGKAPPRTIIELMHIEVPANMNMWPLFHNGVAAGLRIASNPNKMVDSSWILFNKPTTNTPVSDEHYTHAGFLLALGLNGLLDKLPTMELHDYLSKGNDLTKVAILLGLAACKRGTMDASTYVILGIHLEGLLPSTSTEINVSPIVKVAAILSLGLLFQGTGQSYVAEVMLNEIGRPPGPEMEHYIDRESYALSAGLAFGMVALGRGNEMMSVLSLDGVSIPDQLNNYMIGVHKKLSVIQKEKNKTPSYHIREGDCINADVTSPGATLALGMMFFDTHNTSIAEWLTVPDTQNLLETVRPDFILLRVLAKNLILWRDIRPTIEWIESHIPAIIHQNAFQKVLNTANLPSGVIHDDIDYETMTQSYCNIIAGACFALALRYAGSADKDAFAVVHKYTIKLVTLNQKGSSAHIEQAGRSTIESCLNVLIVSCSIIMAGTGNEEVMRICRYLRSRINQGHVLYGSFMAIHMALGLLFLGGCKITLNNSPQSVAALICAFFPKYPMHTLDNRYHLQAFRHLYVLATEPRLLVPRCIETGVPVFATIHYSYRNSEEIVEKLAPCLLPELNTLRAVFLEDENYWRISFEFDKNFHKLSNCLKHSGNLFIKRKVKGVSYNKRVFQEINGQQLSLASLDQKVSFLNFNKNFNLFAQSFTLFDLTNETILKTFSQIFLSQNDSNMSEADLQLKQKLCSILYECAEDETMELFVPLAKLISACHTLSRKEPPETRTKFEEEFFQQSFHKYFTMWQIKFAHRFIGKCKDSWCKLRFIKTIYSKLEKFITANVNEDELGRYLKQELPLSQASENLIDVVVFYSLPSDRISTGKGMKFLALLKMLQSQHPSITVKAATFLYHHLCADLNSVE